MRVSWLGQVTGLSPHTLTSTLNTLQALGLAQDDGQRSGWHLVASLQEQLLARAEALPVTGECQGSSPPGAGSSHARQALPAGAASPPTPLTIVIPANDQSTAQTAVVDGTRPGLPPEAALAPSDQPGGANREPVIYHADFASAGSLEARDESATIGVVVDRGTALHAPVIRGTAKRGIAILATLVKKKERRVRIYHYSWS